MMLIIPLSRRSQLEFTKFTAYRVSIIKMIVKIKQMNGQTISVELDGDNGTVRDLKLKLQDMLGCDVSRQRLISNGTVLLDENATLDSLKKGGEDLPVLHLVIKPVQHTSQSTNAPPAISAPNVNSQPPIHFQQVGNMMVGAIEISEDQLTNSSLLQSLNIPAMINEAVQLSYSSSNPTEINRNNPIRRSPMQPNSYGRSNLHRSNDVPSNAPPTESQTSLPYSCLVPPNFTQSSDRTFLELNLLQRHIANTDILNPNSTSVEGEYLNNQHPLHMVSSLLHQFNDILQSPVNPILNAATELGHTSSIQSRKYNFYAI